jgi:2-methylcitrate dehydratase PrpD
MLPCAGSLAYAQGGQRDPARVNIQATLAAFAASCRWDQLPAETQAHARALLLDTFACGFGGSTAPGVEPLLKQVRVWKSAGGDQSSIIVFGDKVTAPFAALANSTMMHALDWDDTIVRPAIHTNVIVLPALMAAAEARGGIHGKEFLSAYVAGLEIACRLGRAGAKLDEGWLPTTIFGIYAAAAAAARAMALSSDKIGHAIGIAHNFTGGNRQGRDDGAMTKRMQPGFYAQNAVISAALAAEGITGPASSFDGDASNSGLYPLFVRKDYDLRGITDQLGNRWVMNEIGLKPYPASQGTQKYIEAAVGLAQSKNIDPSVIKSAKVYVPRLWAYTRPFEIRDTPQIDAQFSIAYLVATALQQRKVGLDEIQERAVRDPNALDLSRRIVFEVAPPRDGTVEVTLTSGEILTSERIKVPSGQPGHPLPKATLMDKLKDGAKYAARPIAAAQLDRLVDLVGDLERTSNSNALVALLVAQPT